MERNPVAVEIVTAASVVADCSTVELLNECISRCGEFKLHASSGEIAREYALAVTHIEDAITRANKGHYMQAGTFAISDAERAGS